MGSCLTTSYTCFCAVCLLEELFVAGRVVSWGRWEASELGRWERGGGGRELGRGKRREVSNLGRGEKWEGSEVARLEEWEGREVVSWER